MSKNTKRIQRRQCQKKKEQKEKGRKQKNPTKVTPKKFQEDNKGSCGAIDDLLVGTSKQWPPLKSTDNVAQKSSPSRGNIADNIANKTAEAPTDETSSTAQTTPKITGVIAGGAKKKHLVLEKKPEISANEPETVADSDAAKIPVTESVNNKSTLEDDGSRKISPESPVVADPMETPSQSESYKSGTNDGLVTKTAEAPTVETSSTALNNQKTTSVTARGAKKEYSSPESKTPEVPDRKFEVPDKEPENFNKKPETSMEKP